MSFSSKASYARIALCSFGVAAAVALAVSAGGCSSDNDTTPTATCEDAKCAPGNKCLALNGETKCRKVCSSNADPATSCPFGYTCVGEAGAEAFCVQDQALRDDGTPVVKAAKGQWGAPCNPTGKIENPDCDTAQGFFCYGTSPSDGASYCTRYSCETDRNCGAGFWCATVNTRPNVQVKSRGTIGEVQKVCLKREFCATCKVDLDCPPREGIAQHCIPDAQGTNFCTIECGSSNNCPYEAVCTTAGAFKACVPRAGSCVGDGSLCSPCRSDADCGEDGACVKGEYTTERFCAKKSTSPCTDTSGGSCPKTLPLANEKTAQIGCSRQASENLPEQYCVGLWSFGEVSDLGCYTPAR